jgi:hypothetical protein
MLVKMDVPVLSEIGFVLVDITRFFWGKPQSPNISFLTSAAKNSSERELLTGSANQKLPSTLLTIQYSTRTVLTAISHGKVKFWNSANRVSCE